MSNIEKEPQEIYEDTAEHLFEPHCFYYLSLLWRSAYCAFCHCLLRKTIRKREMSRI